MTTNTERTTMKHDLTALDPCPTCGAERLEWMTGRLFCQACGVDAHAAHAERRHVTVAAAAKAVRARMAHAEDHRCDDGSGE